MTSHHCVRILGRPVESCALPLPPPQAEAERQKLAKVPGMLNPYENNEDMNNSD